MTLQLDIPVDLQSSLMAEAVRHGMVVEEYILHLLRIRPIEGSSPANGKELVAYWRREGLIGSRPEITDSQAHARALREQAENRSHP
jgi:hypothetical protein